MSNSSLFSGLEAGTSASAGAAHELLSAYHYQCSCAACAGSTGDTGHGMSALAYATTPGAASYQYAAAVRTNSANAGGADALIAGSKWSGVDSDSAKTVITYSFAGNPESQFSQAYAGYRPGIHEFSDADRAVTRQLLDKIEAVCNVKFVEVGDDATTCGVLRYAYSDQPNAMGFAGYSYFPSASAIGGDVWIGNAQAGAQWDFYRPNLILHETLHAIGLKHPFDGAVRLSTADNVIPNTVMSYSAIAGSTTGSLSSYPAEPMPLDTAALQQLYGAATHENGNTVYDLGSASWQDGFHAIWDSGGIDTLDASHVANAVTLDLSAGGHSDIGVVVFAFGLNADGSRTSASYSQTLALSRDTVIENATGSAFDDRLVGNQADNVLQGGAGNDILVGGGGNDTLDGGAGFDIAAYAGSPTDYRVGKAAAGRYTVTDLTGKEGTDTLTGIERLIFGASHLALDLDGNAGMSAKMLGAMIGRQAVQNKAYVGIALNLFDSGMSEKEVAQVAVDAVFGGPVSNQNFVAQVYLNLTGAAPSRGDLNYYTGLLDSGAYSQASLAVLAAETDLNKSNINLVGLAQTGIEYAAVV